MYVLFASIGCFQRIKSLAVSRYNSSGMLHHGLNYEAISITFSGLPYLEDLTIRAKVFLHHSNSNGIGPDELQWYQYSPIPAITHLVKTAPFLKYLTLDFYFLIHGSPSDLPIYFPDWSSLVLLLAQSYSPSTTLKISADTFPLTDLGATAVTRSILLSLGRCVQVMRMVKQGVLVIIPEVPEPDNPEMGASQTDLSPPQAALSIDDGIVPPASQKSGLKWWGKLLAFATSSKSARRLLK